MNSSALTVLYKLDNKIDKILIADFFKQLTSIANKNGKLNLILETYQIDNLRNINNLFTGLGIRDELLKTLRKFALITDMDWKTDVDCFVGQLSSEIEIEVFDMGDRDGANAWIREPRKIGSENGSYSHFVHLV